MDFKIVKYISNTTQRYKDSFLSDFFSTLIQFYFILEIHGPPFDDVSILVLYTSYDSDNVTSLSIGDIKVNFTIMAGR